MEHLTKTSSLTGKKVIILGGSAGIGLATAKAAAAEGAQVIIVSGNQQRMDKALSELPNGSQGFAVDLSNEQQIQNFFNKTGKFDHLVYTAADALTLSTIADTVIDKAKQFLNLRYWGAVAAVKYAVPNINAGGSIVLTGGSGGARPGSGWSLASSVCTMMEGFTRAMAVELAPIRVNLVVPGIVKTDLWNNMPDADRDGMYAHFEETLPVKFVAEAADIAESYLYLMRQQYSTGQSVVVDGGYVLV